jgi:hypothetical protein
MEIGKWRGGSNRTADWQLQQKVPNTAISQHIDGMKYGDWCRRNKKQEMNE